METMIKPAGLPDAPPTQFRAQNWVITPVALALNEAKPATILQQKWQLVLSGVAEIDFKSANRNDWNGANASIIPEMDAALWHAINQFAIPVPLNSPYIIPAFPSGIRPIFLAERTAIYAALGSIYDAHTAVDAGFSVNTWNQVNYGPIVDGTGGHAPTINNAFLGINVVVAVRDIDAYLYRVNYHITLIGQIAFVRFQG